MKEARLFSTVEDIDGILEPLGIVKTDCRPVESGGCIVEYERKIEG